MNYQQPGFGSSLSSNPFQETCPTPLAYAIDLEAREPDQRPIRIAVAGTTCTDHSAMGTLAFISNWNGNGIL